MTTCHPRPARVVPETRDPLKPDDNIRRGDGCVPADDTDTILSTSVELPDENERCARIVDRFCSGYRDDCELLMKI